MVDSTKRVLLDILSKIKNDNVEEVGAELIAELGKDHSQDIVDLALREHLLSLLQQHGVDRDCPTAVLTMFRVVAFVSQRRMEVECKDLKKFRVCALVHLALLEDFVTLCPIGWMDAVVELATEVSDGMAAIYKRTLRSKQKDVDNEFSDPAKHEKRAAERRVNGREFGWFHLWHLQLVKLVLHRYGAQMHACMRAKIMVSLMKWTFADHKGVSNCQGKKAGYSAIGAQLSEEAPLEELLLQSTDFEEDAVLSERWHEILAQPASKEDRKPSKKKDIDYAFYKLFWETLVQLHKAVQQPDSISQAPALNLLNDGILRILSVIESIEPNPHDQMANASLQIPLTSNLFRINLDMRLFRMEVLSQILWALHQLDKPETKARLLRTKERVEAAVRKEGVGFAQHAIKKDIMWTTWKTKNCYEFEPDSREAQLTKSTFVPILPKPLPRDAYSREVRKPKAHFSEPIIDALKNPRWSEADVQVTRREFADACAAHLERLVEDDKEENHIEEEYKGRNDKIFMWQTRRLFSAEHMGVYMKQKEARPFGEELSSFIYLATGLADGHVEKCLTNPDTTSHLDECEAVSSPDAGEVLAETTSSRDASELLAESTRDAEVPSSRESAPASSPGETSPPAKRCKTA